MKAPDKIYIQEDKHSTNTYIHPIWYSIDDYGRVEYIRKDFLADKLAHAKALREKSGSKDTEVFDALINLIQEL